MTTDIVTAKIEILSPSTATINGKVVHLSPKEEVYEQIRIKNTGYVGRNTPPYIPVLKYTRRYTAVYRRVTLPYKKRSLQDIRSELSERISEFSQETETWLNQDWIFLSPWQNVFYLLIEVEIPELEPKLVIPAKRKIVVSTTVQQSALRRALYAWRGILPPIAFAVKERESDSLFSGSSVWDQDCLLVFRSWATFIPDRTLPTKMINFLGTPVSAVYWSWLTNNVGYLETNLPEEEWQHIWEKIKEYL